MAVTQNEDDGENVDTEVVSTRIPTPIKREMQHEAINQGTNLSTLVNDLLLGAWADYQSERADVEGES